MKNRWLLNLALLAIIAVLVVVTQLRPGKEDAEKAPLTALHPGDITRIRLQQPRRPEMVLEKKDGQWRMTKPIDARTNEFNVNKLLQLSEAPVETHIAAGSDALDKYGLQTPHARLWLDDREIALGDRQPVSNGQYAHYDGQVYLLAAGVFHTAESPYTDFIDSRLIEPGRELTAVGLPKLKLELHDGVWRMDPSNPDMTTDQINDFVAEWQNARALSVDKYSGKHVVQRISLQFRPVAGQAETLSLGILSYKPEFILYRKDEGLEYRFTEATGNHLLEPGAK